MLEFENRFEEEPHRAVQDLVIGHILYGT